MLAPDSYRLTKRRGLRALTLRVNVDGTLRVSAPRWATRRAIDYFLREHSLWIEKQRATLEAQRQTVIPKRFESGEHFTVAGRDYPLIVLPTEPLEKPHCTLENATLIVRTRDGEKNPVLIQKTLQRWYREQALETVQQTIARWSPALGVEPRRLSIGNQKSRWGSCSSRGSLRFNWRLALMPPELLEYVVIHELAHLRAMNHSKEFWDVVESVLPDHKRRRKVLRQTARRMGLDGFTS